jgi:integrase
MARKVNRLTAVAVNRETKPGYHADGAGLYLRIGPTGGKSWSFRYRAKGHLYDVGLGPIHTVTLAEAREKALELRREWLAGVDPRAKRRQQKLAAANLVTFRECADAYIAAHKAGWGATTVSFWSNGMRFHVHPVIGDLPVQEVEVGLVMKVIEPLWTVKTETANRLRGMIENILDWATTRGHRTGENPARWRGHLANLLPKRSKVRRVKHHAALPYAEAPGFFDQLRLRDGTGFRALELLLLTATRVGEAVGARWVEVDLANRVWTVSAERMKGRRDHRVPLSSAAVALLQTLAETRENEFILPGRGRGRHLSVRAVLGAVEGMPGYGGRITVHGLRSTFRDWAAEETSFANHVCEAALAHVIPGGVERAYRRGDLFAKRRELMEAWAGFLHRASPAASDAPRLPDVAE